MRSTYIIETQQWEVNHLNDDRSGLRMTAAASDLFALGMGAVNLNNSAVAQTVIEQFHKRFDSPNSQSSTTGQDAVRIMAKQLEGLLLWKEGKTKESLKVLRETTRMEDALPYEYGPPIPVKPTHELLGEILVELGEHEEAKKEFALALARTPQRALSLAGLSRLSP
jgi:hypothetical protein